MSFMVAQVAIRSTAGEGDDTVVGQEGSGPRRFGGSGDGHVSKISA